jgi:putative salt-induced outer membrane protein YdiY
MPMPPLRRTLRSPAVLRCALVWAALCASAIFVTGVAGQEFLSFGEMSRLPTDAEVEEVVTPPPGAPSSPSDAAPPTDSSEAATPPAEEVIVIPPEAWEFWAPGHWDPWEGSVELGLSGTEGNTQTFNVRAGFKAKHKTEFLVRTLEVTSIQKSADGITTANTALVDGRIEWPMPSIRWNYYIHGLAEYDQFKAFDYRLSADTGVGYEFIQTERTMLTGRAGLSASREIGGPNDRTNPELAFGGEFKHKFNDMHSINGKVDYYPNVTDFSDFRLNSQAGWEIALSKAWGLSLKLSVIDRYDSTPQGARPNDLDYSTLLIWVF